MIIVRLSGMLREYPGYDDKFITPKSKRCQHIKCNPAGAYGYLLVYKQGSTGKIVGKKTKYFDHIKHFCSFCLETKRTKSSRL
jgi:hypothetical protein